MYRFELYNYHYDIMEKKDDLEAGKEPILDKKEIAWHKQLRDANPDNEYADDDSLNNGVSEYINNLQSENATGKEMQENAKKVNEALISVFEAHPEVANFMDDLIKGASAEVALARNFDLDNVSPQEGEPDYEEWSKASEGRKTKQAESQAFSDELDANKVESTGAFQKFAESKGMDETAEDEFLAKIDGFLADIYRGKVTPDFLEAMHVAVNHKTELDSATEQARVEERNKSIEAKKVDQKAKGGDGLPNVKSSGENKETPKPVKNASQTYADKLLKNHNSKQIDM